LPNLAAVAETLFADTAEAITARGRRRLALLGATELCLDLYARLTSSGVSGSVTAIYDPRPERQGLRIGPHTVRPLDPPPEPEVDLLVVCADADKEALLLAFTQSCPALPEVVLAGIAHFEFRDPLFVELTEKKLVKSTATGSPHTLIHLFQSLRHAAAVGAKGAIVEFGMYKGGTTVMLAKIAEALGLTSQVIGFDAFTGFPPRRSVLDLYADPVCEFTNLEEVRRYCDPYGIEIVPGDISETYHRLDDEPLLLSFFDTDNYSPSKAALPLCIEQTVQGGSIVFDHVYSLEEFRYTLGERIAAYELLSDSGFFHLHGTGVFTRTH
jgi:O-methyltransferase